MIWAAVIALVIVSVFVWQDGLVECNDGRRYTSSRPQPSPFHRRWCGWPKRALIAASLGSLVALGALMGTWKGAALLLTLPGAWVIATRPTTVDAPCMLAAWGASIAQHHHLTWVALGLSCVSGFVHERGPVFAALYAWTPLMLVGLIMSGWWRKPAPRDEDHRVGHGFFTALIVHRTDNDWLNPEASVFAMRGLPMMAAWLGTSTAAWCALGLAWASRAVGTDLGRFVFWAAPLVIRDMPEAPAWAVMIHAVTFRRMA